MTARVAIAVGSFGVAIFAWAVLGRVFPYVVRRAFREEGGRTGGMTLHEALNKRRSQKAFLDRKLTPGQIAQLCWSAQGITEREKGLRTAPSAQTLYSIGVYVVNSDGLFEYLPRPHSLRRVRSGDVLADLRGAASNQPSVGTAPFCLLLAMNLGPLQEKTGPRAERYASMEAGHIAQNVLLEATALGLAGIPVAGFDEEKVAAVVKLAPGLRPLYLLPVGYAVSK